MPIYEYRCRVCDALFEARRPMVEAGSPIACPGGHGDTTRLLSVFASLGASSEAASTPAAPSGGCGPGCACVQGS